MSKVAIEKPKVFISYAWSDKEYEESVLFFASSLAQNGVEVVLDKWELAEGNDTYAFMERCVFDDSITNVLILLDPIYEQKANSRAGGVGTETQIISEQVYKKVSQDKFIPIVMKRNEKDEVCVPVFLKSRLYFDLTNPELKDAEYKRLVRHLFGVKTYIKPELGKRPKWVDEVKSTSYEASMKYDILKAIKDDKEKMRQFKRFLEEIKKRFIDFATDRNKQSNNEISIINIYDQTNSFKNDLLMLIQCSDYVDNSCEEIARFFEETRNGIMANDGKNWEMVVVRLHELFIYAIAFYLKNNDFVSVGKILGKTYFLKNMIQNAPQNYNMLYSSHFQIALDEAICNRDGKRYATGTGQYWIESISIDFCTKEEFVLADLICYNYSLYGSNYRDDEEWFPLLYPYDNRYNSVLKDFSTRLISEDFAEKVIAVFSFDNVDDFVEKFSAVEARLQGAKNPVRFNQLFESASVLGWFIKADQIASLP